MIKSVVYYRVAQITGTKGTASNPAGELPKYARTRVMT